MNPIDPESLIYRFAKQLEFGSATMQVASEAVRIVQRMNRDWMTTGRRPAGVCGAALILAARMNNFRRTVREVVYVVKVTEITISQRLNEFSSTESGELTIDQFRSVQLENSHDPPSFSRARKPGRVKRKPTEEDSDEAHDPVDGHERVDADGFAIPSLPVDPTLNQPPAEVTPKTYQPSAEQLASEEALEKEMSTLLATGSNMIQTAPAPAPAPAPTRTAKPISSSTEIDAREFETDPEVAHCLLAPAEVEIKERIWVHENKDYLRTQQAKALKRALAEADSGPGVHKPRKRRRGRLGDVGYLEGGGGGDGEGDGEEGDGRSTRASTPAEATRRMLERRGFSKKINYRLLETLYGDGGVAESKSRSQSVSGPDKVEAEPEPEPEGEPDEEAEPDEPEAEPAEGDGVEAAFAGDYYDDYSDYSD